MSMAMGMVAKEVKADHGLMAVALTTTKGKNRQQDDKDGVNNQEDQEPTEPAQILPCDGTQGFYRPSAWIW
jgi:hypothetical protein